jgi:hypothetical protein
MGTIYIYGGHAGAAAMHLLYGSALQYVTDTTETWHAQADCTRVELTTPRPSEGERILWQALAAFATDVAGFDLGLAAQWLDEPNLRVLHEAVGIRFGLASAEVSA